MNAAGSGKCMNWFVSVFLYKPVEDWSQRENDVIWGHSYSRRSCHWLTGRAMECFETHWLLMWSCMIDWARGWLYEQANAYRWMACSMYSLTVWMFVCLRECIIWWMAGEKWGPPTLHNHPGTLIDVIKLCFVATVHVAHNCCVCWSWEPIRRRAHTQLVREHSATVVSAGLATVEWSWHEKVELVYDS